MPFFVSHLANDPGGVTVQVNQSGDSSAVQDLVAAPDSTYLFATDPADSGSFRVDFNVADKGPDGVVPNSNFALALFVKRGRIAANDPDMGGELFINNISAGIFNRVAVVSDVGEQLNLILVAGAAPAELTSAHVLLDWTRGGGPAGNRNSIDFDVVNLQIEYNDPPTFFEMTASGAGLGTGIGTMQLVPIDLGVSTADGVGSGVATASILPPEELGAAAGAGVGLGVGTFQLIPPTELGADAVGVGTGTATLFVIATLPDGTGTGDGIGTATLSVFFSPDIWSVFLTDPSDGGSVLAGLFTIVVNTVPGDIPGLFFFEVTAPAVEGPFKMDKVAADQYEYVWNSQAFSGGTATLDINYLVGGLPTGTDFMGFLWTGGAGFDRQADNTPITVNVVADLFIDMQASGTGTGIGSATMDLIAVTELDTAAGTGVGNGTGSMSLVPIELASLATGVGLGVATMDIVHDLVGADGAGVGTGLATFDVLNDLAAATGTGVGNGTASMSILLTFDPAVGTGRGDMFGTLSKFEELASVALGVGTGLGAFDVIGADIDLQAAGTGLGTGVGTMSTLFVDMDSRSFGVGTGLATLESLITMQATATGVGLGVGTFELSIADLGAASGLGVGNGTANFTLLASMQAFGTGIGTGLAKWRTGVFENVDANPKDGVSGTEVDVGVPGASPEKELATVGGGGPERPYKADPDTGLSSVDADNPPAEAKKNT